MLPGEQCIGKHAYARKAIRQEDFGISSKCLDLRWLSDHFQEFKAWNTLLQDSGLQMQVWFKHKLLLTSEPNRKAISHAGSRLTKFMDVGAHLELKVAIFMSWPQKKIILHRVNVFTCNQCWRKNLLYSNWGNKKVYSMSGMHSEFCFFLSWGWMPLATNPAKGSRIKKTAFANAAFIMLLNLKSTKLRFQAQFLTLMVIRRLFTKPKDCRFF